MRQQLHDLIDRLPENLHGRVLKIIEDTIALENEEWKMLEEWCDYEISESGRLRSKERDVPKQNGGFYHVPSRVMAPQMKGNDVVSSYQLSFMGEKGTKYTHYLVAGAFVDNPKELPYVKFKDGDYSNLHYSNLEWSPKRQRRSSLYNKK